MASSALLAALRTGAAACAAALVLAVPGGATAAPAHPGPHHRSFSTAAAHRFLAGFYGHRGPDRRQRIRYVSPQLRHRAARVARDYDLLLCAQNTPRDVSVGPVTRTRDGRGRATVTVRFAGRQHSSFTAYVTLDARRPMRVDGITCRPTY